MKTTVAAALAALSLALGAASCERQHRADPAWAGSPAADTLPPPQIPPQTPPPSRPLSFPPVTADTPPQALPPLPPSPVATDLKTASAAKVQMEGMRFVPATLRIRAGETVYWENSSGEHHTVTADPAKAGDAANVLLPEGAQPFDSGRIAPGSSFQHTFHTPGRYIYFCQPHEEMGMVGEVIVE
jgi:plastocyanin